MGVIYFLSTLPEEATPGRDILPDKVCQGAEIFRRLAGKEEP